ncbi:MAG: hypothetical protein H9533_06015 [Rhodobacteraceae bacterium]|nr:hypothetical protein [Paracoccaceae bacterium]
MKQYFGVLCLGAAVALGIGPAGAAELVSRWGVVAMEPAASGAGLSVRVESVHGWVCEGHYAHPARDGAAVGFPLTCSDDVEGEALMSVEEGVAVMAFNRDDGTHGSAKLRVE